MDSPTNYFATTTVAAILEHIAIIAFHFRDMLMFENGIDP